MYHELHLLLNYLEEAEHPINPFDVPEPMASLMYPDSTSLPLYTALRLLQAKGLVIKPAPAVYTITAKGRKALQHYKDYMEAQHSHAINSLSMA